MWHLTCIIKCKYIRHVLWRKETSECVQRTNVHPVEEEKVCCAKSLYKERLFTEITELKVAEIFFW